jgi:hypothetical protein
VALTRVFSRISGRGCKRRTGGDDLFFFFACHPRKGVNKSLPRPVGRPNFFGVAGGPLNRGAPCHGTNGTMVNPSLGVGALHAVGGPVYRHLFVRHEIPCLDEEVRYSLASPPSLFFCILR